MLTASRSCPIYTSTGSQAHWLPRGFSPWKVLNKDQREEGGKGWRVLTLLIPRFPSCMVAIWPAVSLTMTAPPKTASPHRSLLGSGDHSLPSPLRVQRRLLLYYLEVSLLLWFPCTSLKRTLTQHPPACPNMSVPLRMKLSSDNKILIKKCLKYDLKTMKNV